MKCVLIFGFLLAAVQAKYEFTTTAKDCIKEVGTNEDTIESLIVSSGRIDENNDLVQKMLGCCFREHISNANDLIVTDKFKSYITDVFANRIGGKRKLAALMAADCIEKCKNQKGDTKDITAVRVTNCLLTKFYELKDDK